MVSLFPASFKKCTKACVMRTLLVGINIIILYELIQRVFFKLSMNYMCNLKIFLQNQISKFQTGYFVLIVIGYIVKYKSKYFMRMASYI